MALERNHALIRIPTGYASNKRVDGGDQLLEFDFRFSPERAQLG